MDLLIKPHFLKGGCDGPELKIDDHGKSKKIK
jgi:hypothetical protein